MITNETVVIDFGSWVGPTVLFAAKFAQRVIAIEADPLIFQLLNRNINLNPELRPKIQSLFMCISTKEEEVQMSHVAGGMSTVLYRKIQNDNTGTFTPCTSLLSMLHANVFDLFSDHHNKSESLHKDLRIPLFIKVDVEGFEAEIVPQWAEWVPALKPVLFLSMHQHLRNFTQDEKVGIANTLNLFPYVLAIIRVTKEGSIIEATKIFDVRPTAENLCKVCDYVCAYFDFRHTILQP